VKTGNAAWRGLESLWVVFLTPPFGLGGAVGQQIVLGEASRLNNGSGCTLEISDRDRNLEDADAVIVPGVFSLSADKIHGTGRENGADVFTGAFLCRGEARAV